MDSRSTHGRDKNASRETAPWDTPATRRESLHEDREFEYVKLKQTGRHHRSGDHRPSARKIAVILAVFGLIAVIGIGEWRPCDSAATWTAAPEPFGRFLVRGRWTIGHPGHGL